MFIVLFFLVIYCTSAKDVYHEELTISRLPSQNILSQFRFKIISKEHELANTFELFPRIITELSTTHSVDELYFSLGQGRWLADKWGLPPQPSSPTGAHIHAWISGNNSGVTEKWTNLVNALNGIFCTSLTSVVPIASSDPIYTLKPTGFINKDSHLKYGALGKESLCTENLTPWRTLLPCKQNGLATLFTPIKLYSSLYHSLNFHVFKQCQNNNCLWNLELNLVIVSEKDLKNGKLDWEIIGLTGRKITGFCRAATSSKVYVQVDRKNQILEPSPKIKVSVGDYALYELSEQNTSPSFSIAAYYDTEENNQIIDSSSIVSMSTMLGGAEQSSGELVTKIVNNVEELRVSFSHTLPWYVKLYYHTIQLKCFVNSEEQATKIYDKRFKPAVSRQIPALMEFDFVLPASSVCHIRVTFDKAFLRLREYPPDANHGLYLPSAILNVKESEKLLKYIGSTRVISAQSVILHSNVVLIALPTPDFSMPFNVICFVLTAMTLCFGPLHSFSTQILIPVNTALPVAPKFKKFLRVFLLFLILGAAYVQYHEISLNELRRILIEVSDKGVEKFKKMNNM